MPAPSRDRIAFGSTLSSVSRESLAIQQLSPSCLHHAFGRAVGYLASQPLDWDVARAVFRLSFETKAIPRFRNGRSPRGLCGQTKHTTAIRYVNQVRNIGAHAVPVPYLVAHRGVVETHLATVRVKRNETVMLPFF